MNRDSAAAGMQDEAAYAYASGMRFLVLGPIEVRRDGEALPVGGPKQRTILALLVANVGQPVSLERIVDSVYEEDAADGARHSVQTYISTIRRNLGDIIRKDSGGYVLAVDAASIDAVQFEEIVRATSNEDDPDVVAEALREALAMWRGHAYADVDGRGAFGPEITRLSELRLSALEARIDAELAAGRHRELVGELEALTAEHPLRERFRAQQMLVLYRSSRQTEALRAYERTRTYLNDEIGIDPSPELRNLEQQILEHDPELDLPAAPSVSERAVMVVEVADTRTLVRLDPTERGAMVEQVVGSVSAAVERHGGEGFAQRGSALYAAFAGIGDALAAATDAMVVSGSASRPRVALDWGDVELHESGEVTGPPVRRSAGLVATAHPGQMLLSAEAHQALTAGGESGWLVRALGSHPIPGIEAPQQVFQLVVDGQAAEFPPLLIDASPPPLPMDRRAIAGYELRRPIWSDLSGTTYRAYQPSVGREVIVTVIDPAWANEPRFIQRFEVETQLVARLQHPHIVPVLDYWRDPTGAYLVAPSVGGTTLARALGSEELSDELRRRIIGQVGAALCHAHQLGVVHGGISTDTVLLDGSGNAYLAAAGFVMRLAGAPRVSSTSSPPEQGRGEAITPAADVYGLGVLVEQLLGDHGDVVGRATADRPEDRFGSIDDLLTGLGVSQRDDPEVGFTATRNPYKGLAAFGEGDSDDFFGRSEAVQAVVEMLADHRLVAVVGPSGSGKSSLVKAGVVPAVRAGAIDGSDWWTVTDMYPGSYPFVELESALARVAVVDPGSVIDELDREDRGLVRVIKRILPVDSRLLLVVDQFEEVFTLTREDTARERLLQALLALATDERSDTRVLITLRADFFDRPLQYSAFGELLNAGTFALTTPTADQLAAAIRRPAEGVGVTWEAGLVERIVDDVADAPGTLPLLQYALTELFAARGTDQLTSAEYRTAGGVLGALGTHADEVFDRLDPARKTLTRTLFLRLVAVQPSGEQTRRRAHLRDLNTIGDPAEVNAILNAFGDARLLTFDRDPITRGPTVEVAHEALLTHWSRFGDWIAEARENLLLQQRLTDAADEWERHDRDAAYLLAAGRLAQFESWASTTHFTLTQGETEYLERSIERAEAERSRRRRVRNLVTAGFAVTALVATVLGLLAFMSRQDAAESAELARSRELAASAISALDVDPELSLLLALEAADSSDPTFESVSAIHESLANHRKILTYTWPAEQEIAQSLSTRLSPDGRLLVASSGGTYIEVVVVDSGERLWSRDFGGDGISRATFTHDGSGVIATYGRSTEGGGSGPDRTAQSLVGVHILDAQTGEPLRHLPTGPCGLVAAPELLTAAGDASASFLVAPIAGGTDCGSGDGVPPMALIDLTTGEIEPLPIGPVPALVTPDASIVLEMGRGTGPGDEGSSRVIDRANGREVARLPGEGIAVSADGDRGITVDFAHEELTVWNLSTGQPGEPVVSLPLPEEGAWLSPDGEVLAAVERGAAISLRDAETGGEFDRLFTGMGSVFLPSFSADGSRLLITENGVRAAVFDLDAPAEVAAVNLCPELFLHMPVDVAGGTTVVNANCIPSLSTEFLIDSETYELRTAIEHVGGERIALSSDGRLLAAQQGRLPQIVGPIDLHDTFTGDAVSTLDGMCEQERGSGPDCAPFPEAPFPGWPFDLAFSPDGTWLAMGGAETDAVVVWDAETRQIVAKPTAEHNTDGPDQVLSVAFSPDGERLAASFVWSPRELWLFATDTWTPIAQYEAPATADIAEAPSDWLMFTPNGRTLVAADNASFGEGRIVFMDGTTLEPIGDISNTHGGGITQLALNEAGTLLASAGSDGIVKLWNLDDRSLVQQIPMSKGSAVGGVAFMEDGAHLSATRPADGTLQLLTIDQDELLGIARARVTRTLTETECATYRIDPCPTLDDIRGG